MARSVWKGPVFHPSVLKKIKNKVRKPKIWVRNATILGEFVDHEFEVISREWFARIHSIDINQMVI